MPSESRWEKDVRVSALTVTSIVRGRGVPSNSEVRLETELARVGGEDLPVVEAVPRSERAVEERLDEELGVEVRGRGVERSASNRLYKAKG